MYIEDYWTGAKKRAVMLFHCATRTLLACPGPPPRSPSQEMLVTMVPCALDLSTGGVDVRRKPLCCGLCAAPRHAAFV